MEAPIKKMRFEWLTGFNCIWNALGSAKRQPMSLFYVEDPGDCQQRAVLKECASRNIPVQNVYTERQLTKMTRNLQMDDYFQCKMALKCSPLSAAKWNSIPTGRRWLALHHVQDPQNLGAIIRTGYFFGLDGILLTDKASATPTPSVSRASAGAMEVAPIYTVGSMLTALETFKGAGYRILCTGPDIKNGAKTNSNDKQFESKANSTAKSNNPTSGSVLVVGNEKLGLPDKFNSICDEWLSIPGGNEWLDSLNVSVATGILLARLVNFHL